MEYGLHSAVVNLMKVQVWDATTGSKLYTLEGHETAVYSVCPHYRGNVQVRTSFLVSQFDSSCNVFLLSNNGYKKESIVVKFLPHNCFG